MWSFFEGNDDAVVSKKRAVLSKWTVLAFDSNPAAVSG